TQQYGLVAQLLDGYVEAVWLRNGIAFLAVTALVTAGVRIIAGLVKRFMSAFVMGWVDNVAGAIAGAAMGVVAVGTAVHLLGAVNIGPAQAALDGSALAPQVARASLISTPLCSSGQTEECASPLGLLEDFTGFDTSGAIAGMLGGYDIGALAEVAKSGLTGATDGLVDKVKASDSPAVEATSE
ncbi:MAG: CvpA family protein, partial [Chloroflexi bacterium]|nr:CvpA family protein [Chloroflexota bacterium]